MTSPAWTCRSPPGAACIRNDERTGRRVDTERVDGLDAVVEGHAPARRRLALDPAPDVEHAHAERLDPHLDALEERGEERLRVDRTPAGGLAQARHGAGQLGWEVGRRPVAVDPDADDEAGVVAAQSLRLAEDARELAQLDGRREPRGCLLGRLLADEKRQRSRDLDHEVVRPLEAHGADGQARDLLGGVGHRERDHGGDAPRAVGGDPRRAEPEREEQRGARRRGPGAAVAPTAGGLLARDRDADLPLAVREPVADDVVRRAEAGEPLDTREGRAGPGGHGHRVSPRLRPLRPARSPAARARTRRGARARRPPPGPPR